MKRFTLMAFPAVVAALSLYATPALAEQRDHSRGQGDRKSEGRQSEGRAVERAQPRSEAPRAAPRPDVAPRVDTRRDVAVPNRAVAVPRVYGPRYAPSYGPRYAPLYVPRYAPFWQTPGYYRPYVFRPRLSIGFGVFVGYPVPYTYAYPYPYPYPYSYTVGRPPAAYYGGVVLEIEPYDADVYADGNYVGRVGDFNGERQPLTLAAGTHRIEVQEPGLAPLVFDVTVQPGQVIPYRGDLRPY
jgi:hypothetical protein